jgi:hypothetical protein
MAEAWEGNMRRADPVAFTRRIRIDLRPLGASN